MSFKYTILSYLAVAVVTSLATRFYFPSIQTKTVETTKEVVRNDVQTVIKTVTQPSGAVESTTTITDHTLKTDIDHKVDIIAISKNWLASVSYSIDVHTDKPMYGVDVKYRLVGPVFIGGMIDTGGQPRATLGVEF